ncbi:MAG: sulfotransferase [Haliea sp.]
MGTPVALDPRVRKGVELQRRGEVAAAARIYRGILEQEPEHWQALHYLGLAELQQGRLKEADSLLSRSVAIEPRNANAWSDLGSVRVKADAPQDAVEPFSRALQLAPEHPDALNNMAQALRQLSRFDQARPLLEKLVTLRSGQPGPLRALADVQTKSGDVAAAIETFQEALKLDPDDPRIRLGLGDACESAGRFRQARMQYLAILRREPESPLALSRLLQMREGEVAPQWLETAQRMAADPATPEDGRVRLNIALGYHADRAGEYREAFRHLQRGYDVQAARHPFDSDGYSRAIDRLINTLDRSFYAGAADSGLASERPVFVVGMPRSGTTLSEQILASHSRVAAGGEMSMLLKVSYQIGELSRSGEPYPEGLLTTGRVSLRRMGRRYLEQLDKVSTGADRITDKLPFNFMHLGVIALLFPGAKVVHCQRHPLDNCLSCYFTSFADQIHFANRLDTLGRYYLDYHRLMQHWQEVLPIEILNLPYEAMVADTEAQVGRLLAHCGLEWEDACLDFHRTERGVRTPSRWQVRQPIYRGSVQRWRNYEEELEPLRKILAPILPAGDAA